MNADIAVGGTFPDFVLPDHTQTPRRLSGPALKRQWDAGDKKNFYPYGVESMQQTLVDMAEAVDQYAGTA
jgi:hypothetical protein